MKLDFLTVGKIYIETLYRTKNSQITEFKEKLTGECLNIAINGSILRAKTGILACVGRDAYGVTELLEKYGVDYSSLILSNEKTGRIVNLKKKYLFEGANRLLKFDPSILEKTKIIHVCDDLTIAKKVEGMNTKCILSSSLDIKADIIFSKKEGPGNRILLGKKIKFKDKIFDTKFKKKGKSAFIAGFLTRYSKTQSFDSSLGYAISAMKACKNEILGGSNR
jgi:hypothetical protein